MSTRAAIVGRGVVDHLGHIGAWAGLYVTAAYVCFWQLSAAGTPASWPKGTAVLAVLLSATGVYAFDRVKLSDRLMDPADVAAQPRRYGFLTRHSKLVRALAVGLILCAMVLSIFASPLLPLVIAMSVVGVVLYAPGPRGKRPRPKDLLGFKNIFVAGGVVGLTIIATVLIGPLSHAHGEAFWDLARVRFGPLCDAAVILLLRVIIDAIICDIDDTDADAAHGTRTLPNTIGKQNALWLAIGARVLLALLIISIARTELWVRVAWASVSAVSAISLITLRKYPLRDVVDVSFAVEAILLSLIAAAWA